jgi:hypothetical protein
MQAVSIEDGWQIGYLLEQLENDWVAVFLPQAPTPMSVDREGHWRGIRRGSSWRQSHATEPGSSNNELSVMAARHSQSTPSSPQRVCADGVGSLRLTASHTGMAGFTGNPAVTASCVPKCDVIVVRIDPVHRDAVRASPQRFADRGEHRQAAGAAETVDQNI